MIMFAKPSRWWHLAPYAATATHVSAERTRRGAAMVAAAAIGLTGAFALSGAMTTAQDLLTSRAASVAPVTEAAVDAASLPSGSMYHVVDQIGARELWQQGITGAGVNVAVIDTGIAEVESLGGAGKVAAVVDLSSEAGDSFSRFVDTNGHGTHMAGIIAGHEPGANPAVAAEHPEWFLGVAPDAGIVSVKVAGRSGDVSVAAVITGIDWVVDHQDELDIGVINLSYASGSELSYRNDPLTAAVERAWNAGIVVVAAAGNDGSQARGLNTPANDPYVIAVAGADVSVEGVAIADWASTGDGVRNPDVAAPGAHIDSLRAPGSDADLHHTEGYVNHETFRGSGSSQAAAVVSGAAALLLQANPSLTPDQVKAALMNSSADIGGASSEQAGAGLIQVNEAVGADASAATQRWPQAASHYRARTAGVSATATGASWTGASWTGASWTGASWTGASWTGASWTGASWTGASWTGASWTGASWTGASWTGASSTGASGPASWTGASWTGASWTGASWTGASWTGASWTGASWTGASWTGASWTGASWTGASWTGASWTGASWTGASWTGASWTGASWTGASWPAR